jgi:hypothetical protein
MATLNSTRPGCVTKAPSHFPCLSGRLGTVEATLAEFAAQFGPPQLRHPKGPDTKVTQCWTFRTPRGFANVRDYWWNGTRELSVDGQNGKAALHLRAWLRRHGLRAYPGMPPSRGAGV